MNNPKKVLLDLVAKLNVDGVAFDVVEPAHWMHVCHVVARNAKLAARAEELRQALAAIPPVETALSALPADGRAAAAKAHQDARLAGLQAFDEAAAAATQYSIEIVRTFAERIGAFGGHWPVRIEMQHCNPRLTTSAYAADEAAFRAAFAAIMSHTEIQTLLGHVAGHESE